MVSGIQELAQKVSHLLNINEGEINWNRSLGMNEMMILINGENPNLVKSVVNRYLSKVFGNQFKSATVTSSKKREDRSVDLNMDVTFNSPNEPITINTTLNVGGDQNS